MARPPAIRVEGARELRKALKEAGDDATELKGLHKDIGQVVITAARPVAPYLTGATSRSMRAGAAKGGATVTAGRASMPWVPVIHFGWPAHNIEPQPFLYEGLDDARAQVVEVYEKRIKEISDRI